MKDSVKIEEVIPRNEETDEKQRPTADFSYRERDLLDSVNNYLKKLFRKCTLYESPKETIEVTMVKAYGEAFQNSKCTPQNNGAVSQSLLYNIKLEISWYGRVSIGSSTIGSTTGLIKLLELCNENGHKPGQWEFETKLNVEATPPALAGPAAAEVESCEIQNNLKALVVEYGLSEIKKKLEDFVKIFEDTIQFERVMKNLSKLELVAEEKSTEGNDTKEDTVRIDKDLRRQLLGKAYLRVLDGEDSYNKDWKLNLCTIGDDDMQDLADKIKENSNLENLDLGFNYFTDKNFGLLCDALKDHPTLENLDLSHCKIGNEAIQGLVATLALGGAKQLKTLNLRSCDQIDNIGFTILDGLKMIRKDIEVILQ